jgi:AAA domain
MKTFSEVNEETRSFFGMEIQHALYHAVLDEVSLLIECPADLEFFAVFGPTGVGKSTLCQAIGAEAVQLYSMESPLKPGELPVVVVTAPAAPHGRPDWKELFTRILEELNYPLVSAPASGYSGIFGSRDSSYSLFGRGTTSSIRRALRDAIYHRKVRLILIDEAQHLTKGLNIVQVAMDMDNLKNLAFETKCLIGLLGTYELLPLVTASGQLSRRVQPVHYPRYAEQNGIIKAHFKANVAKLRSSKFSGAGTFRSVLH